MELKIAGAIYDTHNKEIGRYGYSFTSCRYSFAVGNAIHHFFTGDELIEYLEKNKYHV